MHDEPDFSGLDDILDVDHDEEIPLAGKTGRYTEVPKPNPIGETPPQIEEERSFVKMLKERAPEYRPNGKTVALLLGSAALGAVIVTKVHSKMESHNETSPAR